MLKLKKDLKKFIIFSGISIFLWQIAVNCIIETAISIVEEEEEEEDADEQDLLLRLGE